ncbi:hypothetical protein FIBSPDRAFT_904262 [Athelia psychrophila]|uniref:Uncharacterized protein n=1 Tax=Athelia psychrophila TaxID=1759441 RepID=A0A167UZ03_9AGAM|nr:hypothetical protein FIBSPDRAFT_904262 [Fibularhizoctonia sp. CBS 109695]
MPPVDLGDLELQMAVKWHDFQAASRDRLRDKLTLYLTAPWQIMGCRISLRSMRSSDDPSSIASFKFQARRSGASHQADSGAEMDIPECAHTGYLQDGYLSDMSDKHPASAFCTRCALALLWPDPGVSHGRNSGDLRGSHKEQNNSTPVAAVTVAHHGLATLMNNKAGDPTAKKAGSIRS